jgi:hypothetical protein
MKATVVTIKHDQDPESPREWDNIGRMVCWHRRYNLGDLQPKERPPEWRKENVPEGSVELPLFLFDHSGITMRTNKAAFQAQDSQGWDWGQVGFIFCPPEKIKSEYGVTEVTPEIKKKVLEVLECEVKTYDQFLRGEVWGVEYEVNGTEESCWGFFGDELKETGIIDSLPPEIGKGLIEHAWENRHQSTTAS